MYENYGQSGSQQRAYFAGLSYGFETDTRHKPGPLEKMYYEIICFFSVLMTMFDAGVVGGDCLSGVPERR